VTSHLEADDDESRWHLTATTLTMATVPELAEIHDRHPVALPESHWWSWIAPERPGDQAHVDEAVAASRPVMASLREHVVAPIPFRGEVRADAIEPAEVRPLPAIGFTSGLMGVRL